MEKTKTKVIRIVNSGEPITPSGIAREVGVSPHRVYQILASLRCEPKPIRHGKQESSGFYVQRIYDARNELVRRGHIATICERTGIITCYGYAINSSILVRMAFFPELEEKRIKLKKETVPCETI